jgi:hypothetical protein
VPTKLVRNIVPSQHHSLTDKDFMEFTGKIVAVSQKRTGTAKATGNPWAAQEYVIEDAVNSQYPRKMAFEVFGEDRIAQFNIQQGEDLTVQFDIDAREYNGRWFNSIRAWRVDRTAPAAASAAPGAAPAAQSQPIQPAPMPDFPAGAAKDDLPF